jgi:hypothetical protein
MNEVAVEIGGFLATPIALLVLRVTVAGAFGVLPQ